MTIMLNADLERFARQEAKRHGHKTTGEYFVSLLVQARRQRLTEKTSAPEGSRKRLARQLREGAIARRDRDRRLAAEWFERASADFDILPADD